MEDNEKSHDIVINVGILLNAKLNTTGSVGKIRFTCKTAVQKMRNTKDSKASGERDASRF